LKTLTQALLAVAKVEIMPEEALAKLQDEKRRVDAKIAKCAEDWRSAR
jgi:hypothetical protein